MHMELGSAAECDDDDDDEGSDRNQQQQEYQQPTQQTQQATARKFVPGNDFECPLTLDIMHDPVTDALGYTYERNAIESWLQVIPTQPAAAHPRA